MKYVFISYRDHQLKRPPASEGNSFANFVKNAAKLATFVSRAHFPSAASAMTVSVRDGETIITDGPFADTKELLGGFQIYDCKDLDVTLEIAAQIPTATVGHVEIRPLGDG